jgi:hypothetical protein
MNNWIFSVWSFFGEFIAKKFCDSILRELHFVTKDKNYTN